MDNVHTHPPALLALWCTYTQEFLSLFSVLRFLVIKQWLNKSCIHQVWGDSLKLYGRKRQKRGRKENQALNTNKSNGKGNYVECRIPQQQRFDHLGLSLELFLSGKFGDKNRFCFCFSLTGWETRMFWSLENFNGLRNTTIIVFNNLPNTGPLTYEYCLQRYFPETF